MGRSRESWRKFIFDEEISFDEKAASVYRHQAEHQPVYREFCRKLLDENIGIGKNAAQPEQIRSRTPDPVDIPLIPVQVFREAIIRADYVTVPDTVFRSSGTAGSRQSTHEIADLSLYLESCYRGFARLYDPEAFAVLAYLPGYAANPNSSLITMVDYILRSDRSGMSRFLPLDRPLEEKEIRNITSRNRRIMLFGAAFGLLDLIDMGAPALPDGSVVVETGGMKTHRMEIPKEELHKRLAGGFSLPEKAVHSEYGMAEMCSQAWDTGSGWFQCPPWLSITIRDPQDPVELLPSGEEGLIGVADIANVHSLSFILTQDRGVARQDGTFQALGRWDYAELRGCNFLME